MLPRLLAGLLVGLTVTGCATGTAAAAPARSSTVKVDATFGRAGTATTYRPDLVPPGSRAQVTVATRDGAATVTLAVRDLLPGRAYGAAVHRQPCAPGAAGPGELALDLTTDSRGAASVTGTRSGWTVTGRPGSVVLSDGPVRVACVTVTL